MGIIKVKIIVGAKNVGRNPRDETASKLLAIGLAQEQTGKLGNGIGLIGRFELTCH
jgi:hypothetical protein